MANFSKFLEILNGVPKTIDLSQASSVLTLGQGGLQFNDSSTGDFVMKAASSIASPYTIVWPAAQAASSGYVLTNDGTGVLTWSPTAAAGVTSVAFADGSTSPIFTVTGSPITSTGTLTNTLKTQTANTVFAGPSSGSAAQPAFRTLVVADFPVVNSNVGSFTNASITVNANGLITAASNGTAPVTSVSIASTNGFAGSSGGGATPVLTVSTTVNSPVLAGNGTAISAAATTGIGSTVVLSASPTFIGTVIGANATLSGNLVAPTLKIPGIYNGATTLTANTTYAIRYGIPANSETVGDFYVADWDTTSFQLFWVVGLFNSTTSTPTGTVITITTSGNFTIASSDTTFGTSDQGKSVWLGATGAYVPNSTFSPSIADANEKLGIVTSATTVWVSPQMMGIS